jgi:methyl-accepting chemotaxis protein
MDWDTLNTYEDWADALQTLLKNAHDAVASADVDKKQAAQKGLKDFIDNCTSPIKAKELDMMATEAIGNIFEATLDQAMAEIGSRTAELANLTKDVAAVTAAANSDAASIRLDAARKVVDTTVQAVQALNTLKQQLDATQPDDKKVADSITSLITTIQSVRNQVETLSHPSS